ncbi:mitochondrial inner membrane protease subunit 1 isoform 4-T6 [Macrochelys suwanniensis]
MRPPSCKYINRKGYFSIVFQALVDHRGHFMDINAGCSEKVHDACIFWNTGLFRKLQAGTFFLDQKITVREVEMPIMILGDPAYPLKPYMGHLDSRKERFNNRLIYQQRLELWMTELDTVFQQHSHQCQLQRLSESSELSDIFLINVYRSEDTNCFSRGTQHLVGWSPKKLHKT